MSVPPIDPAELDGMSEQSIIEKLYVKTANDVVGSALTQLEQALQVSSSILQTLTALQQQKNELKITDRTVPTTIPGTESAYTTFASQVFGTPITPTISASFNPASVTSLAAQLQSQLTALQAIVGPTAAADPNGLVAQVQHVLSDINGAGSPSAWLLDNYGTLNSGSSSKAGDYQNDLSLAVTAGQSLSDTQKEQVRNYLFIFEEYYKSAGSMLNTINTVIQTMAQNAGRSS